MRVRGIEPADVSAVVAIQEACLEIAQWAVAEYERAAEGEGAWVAEDEQGIGGFLVARRLVEEVEVLNLAVRPDARRNGTGTRLLQAAMDWSKSLGAKSVLLEVRESNQGAIRFYERRGFVVAGRRPKYYTGPIEDALLLNLRLEKP